MVSELLFLESPVQIGIVLLIALIVFGPNKLPEIGRQIGQALRELKRASNEVMNSFNADHEPEPYRSDPYQYDNAASYGYSTQYDYSVPHTTEGAAPVDLTDYTIVGLPIHTGEESQGTGASQDDASASQEVPTGGLTPAVGENSGRLAASPNSQAHSSTPALAVEPGKEGMHHD
ncbi:MAG: Sec-independent protein translocase subunit TatA/TatB [Chthonomonadales bacterium]